MIERETAETNENPKPESLPEALRRQRDSVIRNFLDKEGRLKSIPSQLKKKLIVLEHLTGKLEPDRPYSESEINAFIRLYHDDYATIRREFIVQGFMTRENEIYRRTPAASARRWEELS
ncbi:DUF2087 domain-containing protein [Saccharibacillus alkalitolerans]|uniref:DUF2087 domain-containing protein n=1 Tax=Saccharibacillus alkalitolerans TaxID=2705290 RepID=A0ABX0F5F9_9BACL|nr:DUF2087 domain-containing protein [Saccharibacillus alkalitolerans]NGZ75214.1 DUF2087 domain-containing protein [Saccharibacillus alkalitolerans]